MEAMFAPTNTLVTIEADKFLWSTKQISSKN
jgi:hypothetical protein